MHHKHALKIIKAHLIKEFISSLRQLCRLP
jgi:hypothetical protein